MIRKLKSRALALRVRSQLKLQQLEVPDVLLGAQMGSKDCS